MRRWAAIRRVVFDTEKWEVTGIQRFDTNAQGVQTYSSSNLMVLCRSHKQQLSLNIRLKMTSNKQIRNTAASHPSPINLRHKQGKPEQKKKKWKLARHCNIRMHGTTWYASNIHTKNRYPSWHVWAVMKGGAQCSGSTQDELHSSHNQSSNYLRTNHGLLRFRQHWLCCIVAHHNHAEPFSVTAWNLHIRNSPQPRTHSLTLLLSFSNVTCLPLALPDSPTITSTFTTPAESHPGRY